VSDLLGGSVGAEIAAYSVTCPDLRARLARVRLIGRDVLREYERLHKIKLIHMDTKPGNLVYTDGSATTVTLIDLGNAAFEDECPTWIGTPGYSSPESYKTDEKVTTKHDMWSLGCTLFEVFAGDMLFTNQGIDDPSACSMRSLTTTQVRERVREKVWECAEELGCEERASDSEVCAFLDVEFALLTVDQDERIDAAGGSRMPFFNWCQ
jgi:serine/threonine protein kinase